MNQEAGQDRPMSPRQLVEEFVKRFNDRDATAIADLYHEDAVNDQVPEQPIEGRAAIRGMFEREFATVEMTCIPEIIHEAGNVAILEWRDPLGLRGCGFFTVRDGRIAFQRGYWDKLSFLKLHGLPVE
jgi:limonene-1,2-epoxide hydrolase